MIGACYDVVIAGAGPAGSAAALTLRRAGLSVLVVDARSSDPFRIGEGLPPSAHSLLRELAVLDATLIKAGHRLSHGTRAIWGSALAHHNDHIFNLHGAGLQLDRAIFDATLRERARDAGATVLLDATLKAPPLNAANPSFEEPRRIEVQWGDRAHAVRCRWLIDATGRAASVARKFGATRRVLDRLVAFYWRLGSSSAEADRNASIEVEAVRHGWWYSVLLPSSERLVAFLSDADLVAVRELRSEDGFWNELRDAASLYSRCQHFRYQPLGAVRGADASSARLDLLIGPGWLAVGDAALSFDPLSSKGLANALYTGIRGAQAVAGALKGDATAPLQYAHHLQQIFDVYLQQLGHVYRLEGRFGEAPFWQRRHCPPRAEQAMKGRHRP